LQQHWEPTGMRQVLAYRKS